VIGAVVGAATATAVVVATAAASPTAAAARLDLGRDESVRGALGVDLDRQPLVQGAEAGEPLEAGGS
jgi:hypothetical protein